MRKRKWDKISSGIVLIVSIAWFVIQKLTSFFTNIGLTEINEIIPFIAVFSLFCMVWSFIWDQKIDFLCNIMQKYEADVKDDFDNVHNNLKNLLVAELSKPQLIESRILFDYETNLEKFLSIDANSSQYAQIYVITNDAGVENDKFGDAICENIINNHQYVYITPFEENKFIKKLRDTLFRTIPSNIDKTLLDTAILKNIRHIQNEDLFRILPEYADIVIYQKKQQVTYNTRNSLLRGYYSFQNGSVSIDPQIECYYYNAMTNERARNIVDYIDRLLECQGKIDLSSANYITKKAEKRKNEDYRCDGLFCIEQINPGETILKKGGRFILKKKLDNDLFVNTMYTQVNTEYVVSSLTPAEDEVCGFPINHNCRNPNCGFKSAIEIIATKTIKPDEEILIDYAYFDLKYNKFICKGCENCIRINKTENEIKEELRKNNVWDRFSPYLKETLQEEKT